MFGTELLSVFNVSNKTLFTTISYSGVGGCCSGGGGGGGGPLAAHGLPGRADRMRAIQQVHFLCTIAEDGTCLLVVALIHNFYQVSETVGSEAVDEESWAQQKLRAQLGHIF